MPHRHAEHERVVRKFSNRILWLVRFDFRELVAGRDTAQPIRAGIDPGHEACQRLQAMHHCLGHMPGTEQGDSPVGQVVGLEVELHHAATGHADVALQIPLNQLRRASLDWGIAQVVPELG